MYVIASRGKKKAQPLHSSDHVGANAGTAEHPGSLSFSTGADTQQKSPEKFDIFSEASGPEESMDMSE